MASTLPDSVRVGNITALAQSLQVGVKATHTSWTVQVTGTFVGTLQSQVSLDGTNWVAVNSRQSGTGALKNTFSAPGVFRGSCGGCRYFRVVATAWTSGTAVVRIRTGSGVGAVFSNSIVLVQNQFQYYASTAGGNQGYNATVGVQSIAGAGGNVALFRNPVGALTDVYVEKFVLGTNTAGRIERYRDPTIQSVGTPVTALNRGGSANTPNARMYVPAQFVSTGNGTLAKVTFLAANATEESVEGGSVIIRPGQDLLFRFDPDSVGASSTSIEVVWWESGVLT